MLPSGLIFPPPPTFLPLPTVAELDSLPWLTVESGSHGAQMPFSAWRSHGMFAPRPGTGLLLPPQGLALRPECGAPFRSDYGSQSGGRGMQGTASGGDPGKFTHVRDVGETLYWVKGPV